MRHVLLLNITRMSYMKNPTAWLLDLTMGDPEGQILGHSYLKRLYLKTQWSYSICCYKTLIASHTWTTQQHYYINLEWPWNVIYKVIHIFYLNIGIHTTLNYNEESSK